MSGGLYEIIALAARYLFAALMVLIVIRAWKITIVDSRRAAMLRRMSPETGVCGEFLILTGNGKVRDGMRFPVIREGMIGSSGKADVRLRANGVHRTHAYFEFTKKGLRLRDHASARIYNARGEAKRELLLGDGAKITIGSVEMMLILTVAVDTPAEAPREGLFDIPDDSPVLARRPAQPAYRPPEAARTQAPLPVHTAVRAPAAQAHPSGEQSDVPISRESASQDNVFAPRKPYARHTESQYSWRETVVDETTSRRTVVRESSIDDLFMEHTPAAPEKSDSIPGWDDPWSEPSGKPVITKHPVDDPFDL